MSGAKPSLSNQSLRFTSVPPWPFWSLRLTAIAAVVIGFAAIQQSIANGQPWPFGIIAVSFLAAAPFAWGFASRRLTIDNERMSWRGPFGLTRRIEWQGIVALESLATVHVSILGRVLAALIDANTMPIQICTLGRDGRSSTLTVQLQPGQRDQALDATLVRAPFFAQLAQAMGLDPARPQPPSNSRLQRAFEFHRAGQILTITGPQATHIEITNSHPDRDRIFGSLCRAGNN